MSYVAAHFPRCATVAGVRLQPLCMGHALLLARLGCPLIPGGSTKRPEAGDVAMLLWVCSRDWRSALIGMGGWRARWWRGFVAGRVLARQTLTLQQVEDYLAQGLRGPEIRPVSDCPGGRLHGPTLALLKVAAMADLGLSEEDVLDRPLQLTLWEVAVAAERRGDIELAPTPDAYQFLLAAARAAQPTEVPHD